MSTPSGDSGNPWTQPGEPTRPVPQSPDAPPARSGYGTPSSPSYGKYGQGEALPTTPPPPTGPPTGPPASGPGGPPTGGPPWGQPQWGQPEYFKPPDWQNGPGRFQPSGGLGIAVVVLSTLLAAAYWASALLAPSADRSYEAAVAEGRSTTDVFTAYELVTLLAFPVMIAAWIVTCVWLSRARDNALLINPQGQRRSPVWVWLGWLVPFVSLWFPKQILDDTIKATAPAAGRPLIATGWYWAAWIAMNLLSNLQFRLSIGADPEDSVMPRVEFTVAIATTVALVFWLILVRRVSAIQDRLAADGAVRSE